MLGALEHSYLTLYGVFVHLRSFTEEDEQGSEQEAKNNTRPHVQPWTVSTQAWLVPEPSLLNLHHFGKALCPVLVSYWSSYYTKVFIRTRTQACSSQQSQCQVQCQRLQLRKLRRLEIPEVLSLGLQGTYMFRGTNGTKPHPVGMGKRR